MSSPQRTVSHRRASDTRWLYPAYERPNVRYVNELAKRKYNTYKEIVKNKHFDNDPIHIAKFAMDEGEDYVLLYMIYNEIIDLDRVLKMVIEEEDFHSVRYLMDRFNVTKDTQPDLTSHLRPDKCDLDLIEYLLYRGYTDYYDVIKMIRSCGEDVIQLILEYVPENIVRPAIILSTSRQYTDILDQLDPLSDSEALAVLGFVEDIPFDIFEKLVKQIANKKVKFTPDEFHIYRDMYLPFKLRGNYKDKETIFIYLYESLLKDPWEHKRLDLLKPYINIL